MTNKLIRAALLVSSVALIPAATSAIAAVDSSTYREIDQGRDRRDAGKS
jgi:hypothetical protein